MVRRCKDYRALINVAMEFPTTVVLKPAQEE